MTILYVGGAPRSGSTILARALAEHPGVAAVGEVNEFWSDGFRHNRRCACGRRFRACPHWRRVVRRAFDPHGRVDARRLAAWADGAGRSMWLAAPVPSDVAAALAGLYRALREVTGARVLVDTSKSAGYARALQAVPELEVRAVHLVRDSRATVYSWSRKTIRPRLGTLRACAQWNAYNLPWTFRMLGGDREVRRIRYEDFAARPRRVTRDLLRWVGAGSSAATPRSAASHILSGNPVRSVPGRVHIVEDAAWKAGLPAGARRLATACTWPLLAQYGYLA